VINQFFTFSSTIERLRQGPLSEYLDAYAASVAEQGYTRHSIRRQIVAIADFSWTAGLWIDFCGLVVGSSALAGAIQRRYSDC